VKSGKEGVKNVLQKGKFCHKFLVFFEIFFGKNKIKEDSKFFAIICESVCLRYFYF
jgi:hypothetical protein